MIQDPGSGIDKYQDPGSGINIPDQQNCYVGSFEVSEQSAFVPYNLKVDSVTNKD